MTGSWTTSSIPAPLQSAGQVVLWDSNVDLFQITERLWEALYNGIWLQIKKDLLYSAWVNKPSSLRSQAPVWTSYWFTVYYIPLLGPGSLHGTDFQRPCVDGRRGCVIHHSPCHVSQLKRAQLLAYHHTDSIVKYKLILLDIPTNSG